jgi:hypothetical protein
MFRSHRDSECWIQWLAARVLKVIESRDLKRCQESVYGNMLDECGPNSAAELCDRVEKESKAGWVAKSLDFWNAGKFWENKR